MTPDELALEGPEVKRLHARKDSMRIKEDKFFEIRISVHSRPRWCVICQKPNRASITWHTYRMAHSRSQRTLNRILLTWYRPGMTADIRLVKGREVCQAAKGGGNVNPKGRQRHVGRSWQRVAVDLVGPMPPTTRGNHWILV